MSRMSDGGLTRYCVSAYPGVVFRFLMGQYRLPADPAPLLLEARHVQDALDLLCSA